MILISGKQLIYSESINISSGREEITIVEPELLGGMQLSISARLGAVLDANLPDGVRSDTNIPGLTRLTVPFSPGSNFTVELPRFAVVPQGNISGRVAVICMDMHALIHVDFHLSYTPITT